MYFHLSETVRIRFDHEAKCIAVQKGMFVASGWPIIWPSTDTAQISSHAEWENSEFAKLADDQIKETIMWFWIDMEPALSSAG